MGIALVNECVTRTRSINQYGDWRAAFTLCLSSEGERCPGSRREEITGQP